MEQPQEIEDEEYERTWERVAAIDVAKGSGVVCTRVPDEDRAGRRRTHVWTVKATKQAVIELADHLRGLQIQIVTLESTSDYWRVWWVVLEAAGLKVQLVNARHVKNVPGRAKTDKKDAVWLAKLTERGLLQPSFVPPPEIRRLREFTRLRTDPVHERTRYWARLEKLLERALIKISVVLSKLHHRHGAGDDRGADRRGAKPEDPGGAGDRQGTQQARRAGRGTGRPTGSRTTASWPASCWTRSTPSPPRSTPLTDRVSELIDQIPAAWGADADGVTGPQAGTGPDAVHPACRGPPR